MAVRQAGRRITVNKNNQHITKATESIWVSVIDSQFAGEHRSLFAESAILVQLPNGKEQVIGVQQHVRFDGRRLRTNRAIAQRIARSIRARENRKQA